MPDVWSFEVLIEMIADQAEEVGGKKFWSEEPMRRRIRGDWIGEAMEAFAEEIAARVEKAVVEELEKRGYEIF